MTTVWRFLKVFTLGTWVGSMIFFGFVAGVLFSQLKNPDDAGNIVAILLWGLHILGIVAAIVYRNYILDKPIVILAYFSALKEGCHEPQRYCEELQRRR